MFSLRRPYGAGILRRTAPGKWPEQRLPPPSARAERRGHSGLSGGGDARVPLRDALRQLVQHWRAAHLAARPAREHRSRTSRLFYLVGNSTAFALNF